jgi:hypothetical protein
VNPRKTWARIESGNLDVRFDDLLRLAYAFGFELARFAVVTTFWYTRRCR